MSAFLVNPEHINVMLHAGLTTINPGQLLTWYYDDEDGATQHTRLEHNNADHVGQMLVDANARSVNYRYNEDNAYVHAYRKPRHTAWTPAELLLAIHGYEYQTCETPDWIGSQAWAFCQALSKHIIRQLPGYRDAQTWEITPATTPLAEKKRTQRR